jgi:hypothetical protein
MLHDVVQRLLHDPVKVDPQAHRKNVVRGQNTAALD